MEEMDLKVNHIKPMLKNPDYVELTDDVKDMVFGGYQLPKSEYSWWLRFRLWFKPAYLSIDDGYYVIAKRLGNVTYITHSGKIPVTLPDKFL